MKQATALNLLKSGVNVFLTGSAGAGKTYTLNQYIRYLRERNVAVAITASTGIAATHMNGRTIHSWAGIGIKDEMTTAELKRLKESRRQVREQIIKAQVLIIDEISMLHYKQFNLINQVLKYIKENDEPFGGLQLIVCGDFFQLPPVGKNEENNRNKFCFMSPSWVEANFTVCYLTEQHRQGNDLLSDILNAIRKQYIPKAHIDALLATMQQNIGDTFTHLYTHNINVDSTNDRYLREIDGEEKMFIAEMTGDEFLLKTLRASVRAPEELLLKKHAKVMFVKNHSDLYYSNGSLGEVIGFEADNQGKTLPKVRLTTGEELLIEAETWSIEDDDGNVLASYTQQPLRLAWAITIHKSQGMTIDAAEIDLSKTFEKGQGYVALSRLKSLAGLRLLGFQVQALALDSLAMQADERFQELSEEVELHFQDADLTAKHLAFMRRCGGLTKPEEIEKNIRALDRGASKAPKPATIEVTQELFEKGFTIEEIADERRLARSTIIGHLERLQREQGLDIERIRPDEQMIEQVRKQFKKLQKRQNPEDFHEDGRIKLRPLVESISSKPALSYDDVRLALLFVQ